MTLSATKYLLRELSRDYVLRPEEFLKENNSISKKYEILPSGDFLFKSVLLQEAEKQNGNERIYPYKTLKREIDKYQLKIDINQAVGELGHPDYAEVNPSLISHHIDKIWWEGKKVRGDVRLLCRPTQGKEAIALIESNITLGISSRSVGSVTKKSDYIEVNDDLELICWDVVIEPSTEKAYINESKLIELKEFKTHNIELIKHFDSLLKIRGK